MEWKPFSVLPKRLIRKTALKTGAYPSWLNVCYVTMSIWVWSPAPTKKLNAWVHLPAVSALVGQRWGTSVVCCPASLAESVNSILSKRLWLRKKLRVDLTHPKPQIAWSVLRGRSRCSIWIIIFFLGIWVSHTWRLLSCREWCSLFHLSFHWLLLPSPPNTSFRTFPVILVPWSQTNQTACWAWERIPTEQSLAYTHINNMNEN